MNVTSKIIVLVGPFPPPSGGIAIHLERLAKGLRKRGYQVHCIDTSVFRPGGFSFVERVRRMIGWLALPVRMWRAGLVHIHCAKRMFPARVLKPFLAGRRVVVLSLHSGSVGSYLTGLSVRQRAPLLKLLRSCRAVVFAGNNQRASVVSAVPDIADRAHVIAPGLIFRRDIVPRGRTADSGLRIGAVGLWRPLYRFEWVLRSVAVLQRAMNRGPVHVDLVVSTAGKDSSYRESITSLAALQHDVSISIHEDVQDVEKILTSWDLLVRPTTEDSYGIVVREAISCGIRVVASDVCERARGVILFKGDSYQGFVDAQVTALEAPPPTLADREAVWRESDRALEDLIAIYWDCMSSKHQ